MSKKKLLCTGSAGFVFSNFLRKAIYESAPYDYVSIDKIQEASSLHNLYAHNNHKFYIGDVSDERLISLIFEYERPDIVIHGASVEYGANEIITSNILGTQVIVDSCKKWGVEKLLYVSSDKIYGPLINSDLAPFKENAPYNPKDQFSISKMTGELLVQTSGLNYNIVRAPNIYGQRQNKNKLIPKIIKSVLENKKMTIYSEGEYIRDFLHIQDFCSAVLKILNDGAKNEIYNVSSNVEYSVVEVVHLINTIMQQENELVEFVKDDKYHDFRRALNSDKLKSLGWVPKYKLKNSIENIKNWFVLNQWFLK